MCFIPQFSLDFSRKTSILDQERKEGRKDAVRTADFLATQLNVSECVVCVINLQTLSSENMRTQHMTCEG